ncbi:hypothetical protein KSP40_PGU018350 [Platanthera guangdongensis]|uniref:Methyltransferase type 11 domain-containing protein n=1 Tax=Platanthera guangdongensis TaxID=2320717 RepID=A0ABR2LC11_9ASPA
MADLYRNREQVQGYASYRPNYPPDLFNFILSKTTGRRQLAWDVGTGSGQAAVSLSSLFDAVVATDSSPEQISHAPTHLPNVRFVVTPPSLTIPDLHRLVAPPESIDLITVATALHWLDIPAFFSQAHAVLRRPGGVVAVWGYGCDLLIGGRRMEAINRRIYEAICPYWETNVREMVQDGYAGVDFPFEAVEGVEEGTAPVRKFTAEREMGVAELIGLWQTSTSYQRARKAGVELITEEVKEELKRAWVEEDGGEQLNNKKKMVRFPISLRIGKV